MSFFQEYLDDLVMEKIAGVGEVHHSKTGLSYNKADLAPSYIPGGKGGDLVLQSEAITRAQNAKQRMREIQRAAKRGEKIHPSYLDKAMALPGQAHKYLQGKGKYVPHAVYGGTAAAALGGGAYLYNRNKNKR